LESEKTMSLAQLVIDDEMIEYIRRYERGFAVNVVDDWFKQSLQGRIREYLADNQSLLYSYFRPDLVWESAGGTGGEHHSASRLAPGIH